MKKKVLTALICVLMMLGLCNLSHAVSYNATTDFSLTNGNPNGVWTYGYMDDQFATFHAFTSTFTGVFKQWYTPGLSSDQTPNVSYNYQSTYFYGVAPGQITLHPGPNAYNNVAVLRFTAQISGDYSIVGQFFTGDSKPIHIGVRKESEWLWNGVDAGAFSLSESLIAGETVDFVVYLGYSHGNTPLELLISTNSSVTDPEPVSTPEPASMLLFAVGLAGLGVMRRKIIK